MPNTPQLRIMIADDHDPVRWALAAFISAHPDMTLVGEAHSAPEVIIVAAQSDADVLIIELNIDPVEGLAAIRRIREAHPQIVILVLTAELNPERLNDALDSGADHCLPKDGHLDRLAEVIRMGKRSA